MYSVKIIDGKESNTGKVVNIATSLVNFKTFFFKKKVFRHKMRRIQGKNIRLEDTKSTKHHYLFLMIKDLS